MTWNVATKINTRCEKQHKSPTRIPLFCWVFIPLAVWFPYPSESCDLKTPDLQSPGLAAGTPRWRSWFLAWGLWPFPPWRDDWDFFLGEVVSQQIWERGTEVWGLQLVTPWKWWYFWKRIFVLETRIFGFHVIFRGVVKFPTGEDFGGNSSSELQVVSLQSWYCFFGGCK